MDFHGITAKGAFKDQIYTTVPSWLASDEGRIIYVTGDKTLYFASSTAWEPLFSFQKFAVAGYSDVVADQIIDTLTLVTSGGTELYTSGPGDTITIYSLGTLYMMNRTGVAIQPLKAVYLTNSAGDTMALARANADATSKVIGFTDALVGIGATGKILLQNAIIRNVLVGATPGTEYYLSSTTAGEITSTCPTGAGTYQYTVGFAINATDLLINIHNYTARWAN